MKKKKKQSPVGKYLIGAVGALFLIYGCFLTILWLAGTPTQARVLNFRREMEDRGETIRNLYTYAYNYEFAVAGKTYSGNSKKIQGPVFLKNQGNSFIRVHYLACCPGINCPETDFKPWYKILIHLGVAALLFYFLSKMNATKRKKRRSS